MNETISFPAERSICTNGVIFETIPKEAPAAYSLLHQCKAYKHTSKTRYNVWEVRRWDDKTKQHPTVARSIRRLDKVWELLDETLVRRYATVDGVTVWRNW